MAQLPDWWDDQLVHIRSRPSVDGLRAVARVVSPGSKVLRVRRLGGGIMTATSAIGLRTRSGRDLDVVLKRFKDERARKEWQRLLFAQRLPVPTPEPLALDARGQWFGSPALVMRRLPGRADVRPRNVATWLEQIADLQIRIHATSTKRVPAILREPRWPDGWNPPRDIRHTPLVDEAIAKIRRRIGRALTRELIVAHGDSHPGNLLWTRGRITGVADWTYAALLPRGHEVAYMRADIAVLLGIRAADAYRDAYERLHGSPVKDLALWDLVCGLDALHWNVLWVHPYREQGADLTHERAHRNAVAFFKRALARL